MYYCNDRSTSENSFCMHSNDPMLKCQLNKSWHVSNHYVINMSSATQRVYNNVFKDAHQECQHALPNHTARLPHSVHLLSIRGFAWLQQARWLQMNTCAQCSNTECGIYTWHADPVSDVLNHRKAPQHLPRPGLWESLHLFFLP